MKVDAVMTQNAECIRADATMCDAAGRMKTLDVGSLPVREYDRLVGVITDRDITLRCVAEGHDPRTHSVRHAMSSQVFFCFDDNEVADAAELMRQKKVRRLIVIDHLKRLVGIVSLGDLNRTSQIGK